MMEALIGFILGVVVTLGFVLTWKAEVGAETFGKQLRDFREPYDQEAEIDLPLVRVKRVDVLEDKGESW